MAAKKNTLKLLGEEIRTRREARGLTQDELAARAGLSRYFVGLVELGKRNVSIISLEAITSTLGVSLADVFIAVERRR